MNEWINEWTNEWISHFIWRLQLDLTSVGDRAHWKGITPRDSFTNCKIFPFAYNIYVHICARIRHITLIYMYDTECINNLRISESVDINIFDKGLIHRAINVFYYTIETSCLESLTLWFVFIWRIRIRVKEVFPLHLNQERPTYGTRTRCGPWTK